MHRARISAIMCRASIDWTHHSKASMHDEDHGTANDQPARVNSIGDLSSKGL
jgi:hypothetical protein